MLVRTETERVDLEKHTRYVIVLSSNRNFVCVICKQIIGFL